MKFAEAIGCVMMVVALGTLIELALTAFFWATSLFVLGPTDFLVVLAISLSAQFLIGLGLTTATGK